PAVARLLAPATLAALGACANRLCRGARPTNGRAALRAGLGLEAGARESPLSPARRGLLRADPPRAGGAPGEREAIAPVGRSAPERPRQLRRLPPADVLAQRPRRSPP